VNTRPTQNIGFSEKDEVRHYRNSLAVFIVLLTLFISVYGEDTDGRETFLKKGPYQGVYWPTYGWKSCRPEEIGMDSELLLRAYDYAANPNVYTRGLVIIRKGYIVGEAYFGNFNLYSRHPSYSVAKSFMSALIGIGIDRRIFESADEPISHYYPELNQKKGMRVRSYFPGDLSSSGAKRRITIENLLTMTSGLEWNEDDLNSIIANDVVLMALQENYVQYVLSKPIIHEPGTVWNYSSGDPMLLSGLFNRVLGISAFQFGLEHLFSPIGIPQIAWENDPVGQTIGGWGIEATVREYAKFGYLYSKGGEWEDRQVVPRSWISQSVQPVSENVNNYGYLWWLRPSLGGYDGSLIPDDTFFARGLFTQEIFVIPSKDLVIVRMADDLNSDVWNEVDFLIIILESLLE
jgi:CubicO group peptidase (beta-lactamase class C family)